MYTTRKYIYTASHIEQQRHTQQQGLMLFPSLAAQGEGLLVGKIYKYI